MITFQITDSDHLRPLESFIARLLPEAPPGYISTLLRNGHVVRPSGSRYGRLLASGETVALKESARTLGFLRGRDGCLDILHEDRELLVLNKPAGIAMHRTGTDETTLLDLIAERLQQREIHATPRPINRLDRGTSGVVLCAKGSKSAGKYGRIVKECGLGKRYLALCHGMYGGDETISVPIDGKAALTMTECIAGSEGFSLILATPLTGRMHQIRIHLSEVGHPILGDVRYGALPSPQSPGFCLHSLQTVLHDGSRERIFTAPLPGHFLSALRHHFGNGYRSILNRLHAIASSPSAPVGQNPSGQGFDADQT